MYSCPFVFCDYTGICNVHLASYTWWKVLLMSAGWLSLRWSSSPPSRFLIWGLNQEVTCWCVPLSINNRYHQLSMPITLMTLTNVNHDCFELLFAQPKSILRSFNDIIQASSCAQLHHQNRPMTHSLHASTRRLRRLKHSETLKHGVNSLLELSSSFSVHTSQ